MSILDTIECCINVEKEFTDYVKFINCNNESGCQFKSFESTIKHLIENPKNEIDMSSLITIFGNLCRHFNTKKSKVFNDTKFMICDLDTKNHKCLHLYTKDHEYFIAITDKSLRCSFNNRFFEPGEGHIRGRDLVDDENNCFTLVQILFQIIATELEPVN